MSTSAIETFKPGPLRVLTVTPKLPQPRQPNTMAPVARQIKSIQAAGAESTVLEVAGLRLLKYPKAVPGYWALAHSADLVHAHYGYCGWLARSQRQKPVVVSFMGSDLLGVPDVDGRLNRISKIMVLANRSLAKRVDAVIVKSREMAEVVAPVPAYVIPNGVDVESFHPMDSKAAQTALGWDKNVRFVLFPGDPANPRKAYPLAQEIMQYAQTRLSDQLEMVVLQRIEPELVPLYMNACDAMLMVSFLEGSPNVVKEAMACNLPVVSVPVGDVEQLLTGVPGYAVRPRQTAALGDALVNVLNETSAVAGREAILDCGLDLRSVAYRIIEIYQSVLT